MQRLVDRSAGAARRSRDRGRRLGPSAGRLGGPRPAWRLLWDRPEIRRALTGETAQGTRNSSSLNQDLLFTAVPVLRQGRPAGAVRVTQSVDAVHTEVRNDALALVGVGAAALVLGLGVAWLVAGFLSRPLARSRARPVASAPATWTREPLRLDLPSSARSRGSSTRWPLG